MSRVPRPNPPSTPEPEEPEDLEEDEEGEEMDFGDDDMMDPMEALGSFLALGGILAGAVVGVRYQAWRVECGL